jgi:hypothetical protein
MSTDTRSDERRVYPRVTAQAPLFFQALTRSAALADGAPLRGRLLNASRGGVAFATDKPVVAGDLVEVSVEGADGESCLRRRYARVVATAPHPEHDLIVRCEFAEPTVSDAWLASLGTVTPHSA